MKLTNTVVFSVASVVLAPLVLSLVPPGWNLAAVAVLMALVTLGIVLERMAWDKERIRLTEALEAGQAVLKAHDEAQSQGTQAQEEVQQVLKQEADRRFVELSVLRFRFAEAARLAALSLENSEQFAGQKVQEVLGEFQDLAALAMSIEKSVSQTLSTLIDPHAPRSLGAIVEESQAISTEINTFFSQLNRLHDQSQGYLRTNASQLGSIKKMSETIEEFFESIRMISLNLSIEASRIGGGTGGKALQVLAQRLREFSNRAQELSAQQKEIITSAEAVLLHSETDLGQGFEAVAQNITPLHERLDPFPEIVRQAHGRFDLVIQDLTKLSTSVRSLLTNSIGRFQFQDLNRQEHQHLAEWLDALHNLTPLQGMHVADDRAEAERESLAQMFNQRITTSNEREVLLAYLKEKHISSQRIQVKGSDREEGSVVMF